MRRKLEYVFVWMRERVTGEEKKKKSRLHFLGHLTMEPHRYG